MKQKTFTLKTNLFTKFLLSLALILATPTAWADTVILSGSTYNSTDWATGQIASATNKVDVPGGTAISSTGNFTSQTDYLQGYKYSWYAFYSKNLVTITTGQKIVISAQGMGSTTAQLFVRYSSTSKTDNSTYTLAANFTTDVQSSSQQENYTDLVVSDIPAGSYYIQIVSKAVNLNGITIQDATIPVLSVSSTNVAMGNVISNTSETITVSNTGAGSMDVTISNSNTDNFVISESSLTGITNGGSKSFDVTFDYSSATFGEEKSTTITVTPNVGEPIEITVTATALNDNDPQLSVTPDENVDLGSVYSGETTYTVTNAGTGSMTVNISSNNSDFVVSPTTIENLGYGESETFTVTYTFAATAEKLGANNATITVTPTYTGGVAKTYQVTATSNATMTIDENEPTTINYGTKAYLHVKYTPSNGWNTISMPFVLRNTTMNNMDRIFGEGWKAYTLSSYNDGTLTFSKVGSSATISSGIPYLVYIETALSHPNGVLLQDISTSSYINSPSKNGATFQVTYTTKTYTDGDNWYGVTSSGKVMKAGTGASVKGYRAYLTGVSAPSTGVKMIILEDDGGETDLGFVKMVDENAKDVYTLTGQKVQKGRKGIYIVNGKKVVIK